MLDTILRMIYRRFRTRFEDYLVEDYLHLIPEKTKFDAFGVMSIHKRKFQKMNDYFAYQLHRRMATDQRNSDRYQGMFIQLKMYDQMIAGRPDPEQEIQEVPVEQHFDYNDAIEKAKGFAAKFKKRSTQG